MDNFADMLLPRLPGVHEGRSLNCPGSDMEWLLFGRILIAVDTLKPMDGYDPTS